MTDIVKLNVGGSIFQTTKSTLTKFDGFFRTMFETGVPVTKDESGAIFIDRDPKHFRLILNFMRDGHVDLQKYSEDVKEIQKEAEYYLLEGLVELCTKNQTPEEEEPKIKKQELEYPNKLRFIKSDEELFEVLHKPEKPVIILIGSIRSEQDISYPHGLDLLDFQKKHASDIEIYIRILSFSNYMGSWHCYGYPVDSSVGSFFDHEISESKIIIKLENAVKRILRN
ncbi:unnamed protein product [Caenorhabditis nigoni]